MSNWERRDADTLADAIIKHRKRHLSNTTEDLLLEQIQHSFDAASNTVLTSESDLVKLRSKLCTVCRNARLYECDIPSGWSANCTFIFVNTSTFTPL